MEKSVFVVFYAGDRARTKITKVCFVAVLACVRVCAGCVAVLV